MVRLAWSGSHGQTRTVMKYLEKVAAEIDALIRTESKSLLAAQRGHELPLLFENRKHGKE